VSICSAAGGGFGPGYLVRLGCRATGPGLIGQNETARDPAHGDPELRMREVGHSDKNTSRRYTHPLEHAHLAAADDVEDLIRKAGTGLSGPDVPRMFPKAAVPWTGQPDRIERFRR
jgi:hypothetical protein